MRRKKAQVELEHDGRPPLRESVGAQVRERSGCQSFVADLTSIVSAAHELPAEVDPPARVWASLQAQLEREGILGRSVRGRLQEPQDGETMEALLRAADRELYGMKPV